MEIDVLYRQGEVSIWGPSSCFNGDKLRAESVPVFCFCLSHVKDAALRVLGLWILCILGYRSVDLLFWFRIVMGDVPGPQRMIPADNDDPSLLFFTQEVDILCLKLIIFTTLRWIAGKICSDFYGALWWSPDLSSSATIRSKSDLNFFLELGYRREPC